MIDAKDKAILRTTFKNYDAKYHDAFKIAYIKWLEARSIWAYEAARGFNVNNEPNPADYEPKTNYICIYCDNHPIFPTQEALSTHIIESNHIRDNYIESLALLQKLANNE
jgi:hypothetical protein